VLAHLFQQEFFTVWGMIPFILSAIKTLQGNPKYGLTLMKYGFGYLIIVMVFSLAIN
jgi:hypothetical protein